jgi:hypothetical protein
MLACTDYIKPIPLEQCLVNSLSTINTNFANLETVTNDLQDRIGKIKQTRTFFYYGPNSGNSARSGMDNNNISRPSDLTIQAFVNDVQNLNLPSISQTGDAAYVIYQKTGFNSESTAGIPPEFVFESQTNTWTATNQVASGQTGSTQGGGKSIKLPNGAWIWAASSYVTAGNSVASYSTTNTTGNVTSEILNSFAPVLVIWRLTYDGSRYLVDLNFPKFTRAQTLGTENSDWNKPQNWAQY